MKKKAYSPSLWNLNDLELRGKEPAHEGKTTFLDVKGSGNEISKILVLGEKFFVFNSLNKQINEIQEKLAKPAAISWSEDDEILDLTVYKNSLFSLGYRDRIIREYLYSPVIDQFIRHDSWKISEEVTPLSKIIIGESDSGLRNAYICTGKGKQILSISLDKYLHPVEKHYLNEFKGRKTLGKEIHLCIDSLKSTLLISDTNNNRIVEVNLSDWNAEIICGQKKQGDSSEGSYARYATLNRPKGIAIYRYTDFFDKSELDAVSRTKLDHDPSGKNNRMILIADSENCKVKRLIDSLNENLFESGATTSRVYCLVGNGKRVKETSLQSDLRLLSIGKPSDVAISLNGDVLVLLKEPDSLLHLSPSLSISAEIVYENARVSNTIES